MGAYIRNKDKLESMKLVRERINEVLGFTEDGDPIEDMGIGLESQMKKKLKNMQIMDLIWFLDDLPDIRKKYRDEEANYDSAYYQDIPLDELEQYGIKGYMLDKINDNTDSYEGWMNISDIDNTVTLGGGD